MIRLIHVLLQKNSDAVQEITCMGADELMKNKNCFLKVYQDVSNNIQKVLSMNVELELYFEDDDVPSDSTVLALDYKSAPVNTQDVSIKKKIDEAKFMKKTRVQQKKLTLIPDLMLKGVNSNSTSVDSDLMSNLHMNELKNVEQSCIREIKNATAPNCNDQCLLSIYSSPSHFYINLCNDETSIIDSLAMQLTELGNSNAKKFCSKHDARDKINKYCMAYCESWKSWYRAEVIDWLDMYKGDMVSIMLIDYGELKQIHCAYIQPLPLTFYKYPRLAVKCHFAYLYPPGSTPTNLLTKWPKKSFAVLEKASTNKMYLLTYVEKIGDSYGIDLIESENRSDDSLGQRMLNFKLAVEIIPPSKLVTNGVQSSFIRKQIEKAQSNDEINVEDFDSMEKAVTGYEATDEKRICRFTSNGRCFKVDCNLEHTELRKDGITTDKRKVFTGEVESLQFPRVGETVDIKITYIVSLKTFYAHLRRQNDNADRLKHLIMDMNDPDRIKTYEKFDILPASGEIVLAKYWNNKWYRCFVKSVDSVTNTLQPQILVFFVDFGDVMEVALSSIRVMLEEFMYLPFQAVKCNLAYIKPLKTMPNEWCRRYMETNYLSKPLQAEVIYAGVDVLEVVLYESGSNIGNELVFNELAEIQEELLLPAEDQSIFLE